MTTASFALLYDFGYSSSTVQTVEIIQWFAQLGSLCVRCADSTVDVNFIISIVCAQYDFSNRVYAVHSTRLHFSYSYWPSNGVYFEKLCIWLYAYAQQSCQIEVYVLSLRPRSLAHTHCPSS